MSSPGTSQPDDPRFMRLALRLARRGYGRTSPNPMVGAVLVKRGRIIGQGWHQRAGEAHAEIQALRDAQRPGEDAAGATLYVSLEPCSTHGRTPPCTEAITAAGIRRVVCACADPNPRHSGRGFALLEAAGIQVRSGVLEEPAQRLNEVFNHWIVHRRPFVILKAALSLDGKIATVSGESKWITSQAARVWGMRLRQGADAILVGINTILADDPSLTVRPLPLSPAGGPTGSARLGRRRIILDSHARTPLDAQVVRDEFASLTTIVVTRSAPPRRVKALAKRATVWVAAERGGHVDLRWLVKKLGADNVACLLVEGGGEVHGSFLNAGLVQRLAFFYAPKIIGGRKAPGAIGGEGIRRLARAITLEELRWRRLGPDFLLTALVKPTGRTRGEAD